MKGATRSAEPIVPAWRPPLNISRYDYRYTLTDQERAALESMVQGIRSSSGIRPRYAVPKILHRLFAPINDVLRYVRANKQMKPWVVATFAECMLQTNSSFWAWQRPQWENAIGARPNGQHHVLAIAYVLYDYYSPHAFLQFHPVDLARMIFGNDAVEEATRPVLDTLVQWGHRRSAGFVGYVTSALCVILLLQRSPHLQAVERSYLELAHASHRRFAFARYFGLLSRALVALGIIERPLEFRQNKGAPSPKLSPWVETASQEWLTWCRRWFNTSTLAERSRNNAVLALASAGRWLADLHPEITRPDQWTRELAAEYVAAVDRMTIGQYVRVTYSNLASIGRPLSARAKDHRLGAMRCFFRDCQEWGWISRRFDSQRSFATPRSVRTLIGPDPRDIASDFWAKLMWAGLNLSVDDMPGASSGPQRREPYYYYPIEYMRAIAAVWLFAGLRSDECVRLRTGCIQWDDAPTPDIADSSATRGVRSPVCLLHVPINKTTTAFKKPVDPIVGRAIEEWERVRPKQPQAMDKKTGQMVDFLFMHRGRKMHKYFINRTLIPVLCAKAGIPSEDARGRITSHRGRATIASQLVNAREGMTLLDVKEWLGHRNPNSTSHYVRLSQTRLARAYTDADYFKHNTRMIDVLLDQDALKDGAAADGRAWRYYDLGHGYCTYDFFDRCEHRMACAQCSFYVPKESSRMQNMEARANLLRLKQEIALTDEECAALDGDVAALDKLCATLADVPTPSGPTPRQLGNLRGKRLPMVPNTPPIERSETGASAGAAPPRIRYRGSGS